MGVHLLQQERAEGVGADVPPRDVAQCGGELRLLKK
jgi:hypothetical protein